MGKLSAAQSRALEIIKRDYGFETFSNPYDELAKRDVSSATLRKLYQLGYNDWCYVVEIWPNGSYFLAPWPRATGTSHNVSDIDLDKKFSLTGEV